MPYRDHSKKREYDQRYREANRERKRRQRREYYAANRQRLLATARAYKEANRETILRKAREKWPQRSAARRQYREANREAVLKKEREIRASRHAYFVAYREANRELLRKKGREYMRRRRETDPAPFREARRKWREKNPQVDAQAYKRRAARPGWLAHHAKLVREQQKRKYHSDPEWRARLAIRVAQRRALKIVNGPADLINPKQVWDRDKGLCAICGKAVSLESFELDHYRPLTKGGTHTMSNIQLAHRTCNARKGDRWPYPQALPAPSEPPGND